MGFCFLENNFLDILISLKYVIPSIAADLEALNFKISTLTQDSAYQAIRI